jgi:uncharacterized protein (UPF0335 family)
MSLSNMPSAARLQELVGEIEVLEAERAEIAGQIRDAYAIAKVEGYMVKILRQAIRRRKQSADEITEQDETLALYEAMLAELPKGADR